MPSLSGDTGENSFTLSAIQLMQGLPLRKITAANSMKSTNLKIMGLGLAEVGVLLRWGRVEVECWGGTLAPLFGMNNTLSNLWSGDQKPVY